jgi:tetratricopeptide (TPR) repeat protein
MTNLKNIRTANNMIASRLLNLFLVFSIIGMLTFSCSNDKEYNEIIATADNLFDQQKYNDAKTYYLKALEIKEEEEYPVQRIEEIDEILRREAELRYQNEINSADSFFAAQEYEKAINGYIKASKIKPEERYPKDKINEINKLLAELNKQPEQEYLPFHVITGSFKIEKNAIDWQQSLKAKNISSVIIAGDNDFHLVSIKDRSNIRDAYNYLESVKSQYNEKIWVFYRR